MLSKGSLKGCCGVLVVVMIVFLLATASAGNCGGDQSEEAGKRRSLATASGLFCVVRQGADPAALQLGLNYACGPGGADCSPIQSGGACYKANDLPAIVSYAYNDYYHRNAATGATCSFNNTAVTTPTDPSYGQCVFAGSSTAGGSNSTTPAAGAPTSVVPSMYPPAFTGSPIGAFTPPSLDDAAESLMSGGRRTLAVLLLVLPPLFFF